MFKRNVFSPPEGIFASTDVAGKQPAYFAVLTAAVLLLIVPLWTVLMLPWLDFGDHLGRMFILAHYSHVPVFQQAYELKRIPLPNLAMDLITPPLLRFFSPDIAGKVFATLSIVVFSIGCHLFGSAVHGKPTWLAIPVGLLFGNYILDYRTGTMYYS